jgi:hypothetical protein
VNHKRPRRQQGHPARIAAEHKRAQTAAYLAHFLEPFRELEALGLARIDFSDEGITITALDDAGRSVLAAERVRLRPSGELVIDA